MDEGAVGEEAAELDEVEGTLETVAVVEEVLSVQACRRHLHHQVCHPAPPPARSVSARAARKGAPCGPQHFRERGGMNLYAGPVQLMESVVRWDARWSAWFLGSAQGVPTDELCLR